MKKFLMALVLGLGLSTGAAHAIVLPFTFSNGGGDGGGIDSGSSPESDFGLTLTSNNNGADDISSTFTAVATGNLDITFDWTYQTQDINGSSFDPFGYFIDAMFFQVSTDGLPRPALTVGSGVFSVLAGQSFGFWTRATDGILGRSLVTVSGNITPSPIPLPAGGLLLIGALGGLAALRRRKALAA